ncbi:MAG: hypothetical protein HOE11_04860 [Candidatus Diapherotrites archaeon]|nr:hypothetical protein [Candidatus Diapherotrites archaeon]MBT4596978.1 hypothetical protein [Candidatus Diapherotrites archaeon]
MKFNSRGQMSAPFELLVAMIIMAFVVIIGTQMIANTETQMCLLSIDKELTEFKLSIEETAQKKASVKFDFRPEDCFNEKKVTIKLHQFIDDPATCAARCGDPRDSCFIIFFSAPNLSNGYKQKCLDIAEYTTFLGEDADCATTGALEGYTAMKPIGDAADVLLPGTYVLRDVSPAGNAYPKICVFRRA